MQNDEQTVENLENLTTEELEQLDQETPNPTEAKDEVAELKKRNAILQRLLSKKNKPINTNLTTPDLSKDIQEIKFARKIDTFAEENGLTRVQAERILKLEPNATAETLKDPFYAEGIKALARKERVENATPGASNQISVNGKSFKEMTPEERKANFTKFTGAGN
jgi:hypothetical protein